ncbi:MAG TPA: 30S ribosomal protein S20 [Planctomycetes bacterium]|nr:30S ribosomal protein S20 [Planctomycetota bacterium]HIL38017.1 30S ribosomal protein S20 [Planctomycetota bacterium]
MPTSKQAKKRMRTDAVRRVANKAVSSAMKTAMKRVLDAENTETAQAALPNAMKMVDKAAKKNIIHANAAARNRSRLTRAASAS